MSGKRVKMSEKPVARTSKLITICPIISREIKLFSIIRCRDPAKIFTEAEAECLMSMLLFVDFSGSYRGKIKIILCYKFI